MRVLTLGALDVPYIRDNWADALRHVLREDVTLVNASAWLACGPAESHMKYVYRLLALGAYDYLFLYHDYIFSDFPDEFFAHVRSAGVKTLAFHPDDEPEVWYQRNRVFDARFDLVAPQASRGVDRRVSEGRPTCAMYLPWGFNQRFFDRPSSPVTPRYDVVFIGKYKVHDHDTTVFREDGRRRDAALLDVAALCKQRGWRFGLFGYGWERHPRLAGYAGGLLSHDQMVRTYHESRIVLNPAWTADEGTDVPQTKLRHFEVPGCGAFQLTNVNPELAELFLPGREIAFYEDSDDLCCRVDYYLSHEDERCAIADNGYARAHKEHTLDHRVTQLFARATELWPPQRSVTRPRPMPSVKTLRVRSFNEVRALRQRLDADTTVVAGCDLVHVLAADGEITATDYVGLRDWCRADASVFAGRCFFQAPDIARNPLQPNRAEMTGGFLEETTILKDLPAWQRRSVPKRIPAVVGRDHAHFLLNYMARPHAIVPMLDAFLSGDAKALAALQPLPTGLVFSEVRIKLPRPPVTLNDRPAPVYVGPLQSVLRQAVALDQRVAIYGARGDMAETVFEIVSTTKDIRLVALFDRALAGGEVAGVPVHSVFDLPRVAPDVVLIAAAHSGPAIYEQLKSLEAQMALVPLYDVKAPAWGVLVSR